jgi:hypothetical protein
VFQTWVVSFCSAVRAFELLLGKACTLITLGRVAEWMPFAAAEATGDSRTAAPHGARSTVQPTTNRQSVESRARR